MRPKDSKVRKKEQDMPTSPKSTEADLSEEGDVVDIVFETGALQEEASAEIEAVDEADEDMAEIMDKSILGSMISALEAMGEKEEKPAAPGSISIEDSLSPPSRNEEEKSIPQKEPAPDLVSFEDLMAKTNEEELHHEPAAEEMPAPGVAVLEEHLELIRDEIRALKSSTLSAMVRRIGRPFILFGILVVFLAIQIAPFVPLGGEKTQKPWKKIVEVFSPKKQGTAPETSTETPSAAKQGVQPSTADPSSQSLLVKKEIVRSPVLKRQETIPKKATETVVAAEQMVRPLASESPSPVIQPSDGASKAGTEAKAVFTSFPYSVYVGSFKTRDRARTVILNSPSVSYWVRIDLGKKGIWYRVYIGYFRTRDEADLFIKEHQIAEGESRRTPYANLIGTYRSDEESHQMNRSLLDLGFCPYVVKEADGRSRLFTGAFYQRERAEKEHHDLTAKGIQSQLVKR